MTNPVVRPRALILLPLLALLTLVTTSGFQWNSDTVEASATGFRLQASLAPSRVPATDLNGATVTPGTIYVFATDAPEGTTVRFWVDQLTTKQPTRTEEHAPFDLLGDLNGVPRPLDTSTWAPGQHTVHAAAVADGLVVSETSATFELGKKGATSSITAPDTGLALRVSTDPSRSPSQPLQAASLADSHVYVFAEGAPEGSVVTFAVHGSAGDATFIEKASPYDLLGDDADVPRPLATWPGAAGTLRVQATATVQGIVVGNAVASFTVGGVPDSLPTADSTATSAPAPTQSVPTSKPSTTAKPPTPAAPPVAARPPAPLPPGGYPDASSTGVPAGVSLRDAGKIVVTKAGTVLDGLLIRCLDVQADNVTVTNSRVECDSPSAAVTSGGANLVIIDSEIDGGGVASNCVVHGNYTLERVDVTACSDGLRANGNVVIKDSYVHDLVRLPGSHNDTIQTTKGSNIVITGNTLLPYNSGTDDPMNSAYILKEDQGPISNVTFTGNYINGGNYTLYIIGTQDMSNLMFTDNVFGRDFRYGPVGAVPNQVTWSNNVYRDNGSPVK